MFSAALIALGLSLVACEFLALASDWTRRDMPTDNLKQVVTYNLRGPAGTEQEINQAYLRGVNENTPRLLQEVKFDRMSGSKTQDVRVTLPDGRIYQALGMIKTKRFGGLTHYMTLEPATYAGVDINDQAVCGAKIRLDFNRNLVQYADVKHRDFQSLWYYDIPCSRDGKEFKLAIEDAKLRALVLNQVWQARIAAGSFFFNWGHSVTAIGGPPAEFPGGWWTHWDLPGTTNYDAVGAVQIVNDMVHDLESSKQPWVEFKADGPFKDTYLIYSAGDADQYANWNRILLNRQREYAVLHRPDPQTPWDFVTIKPVYNYEWNDAHQQLAGLRGWDPLDPMHGRLDESGMPKRADDTAIKELERVGWMNAPNASLEQIQFKGPDEKILYAMTVRAFIGASDTLVMFGPAKPDLSEIRAQTPSGEVLPMPILYDEKGKALAGSSQPYTTEQWALWQRESTMWNFIKDNPGAVGADLLVQYRFSDNTTWAPIPCPDGGICGYKPIEWNLATSYYFDGDVQKAWLISQLLGEVGVRTLGMSYASGRYEGTGMLFGMAQVVHRGEFFAGYGPESIWTFDARASQLPDRLTESWALLHQ